MTSNADHETGEFERRVGARLAEWQARYDAAGVQCASPLMDQIIAAQQIAAEMASPKRHRGAATSMNEPLTCSQVVKALTKLIEELPDAAGWPVHILDMQPDDEPEQPWDGLVTHIETDCFAEEQGHVVSLVAERSMRP